MDALLPDDPGGQAHHVGDEGHIEQAGEYDVPVDGVEEHGALRRLLRRGRGQDETGGGDHQQHQR